MKSPIEGLRKEFENRVKLGAMSMLAVNDDMGFNELKALLEVTDGNLSSHLRGLEKAGFIRVSKTFAGRKPQTTYAMTSKGRRAFESHLAALEALIRQLK